jgi:6-phosphogluconate dehydrogenase
MQIGIVGLGRMGANIARRLTRTGHSCVVYDTDPTAAMALGVDGAVTATSISDLVSRLDPPESSGQWFQLASLAPSSRRCQP